MPEEFRAENIEDWFEILREKIDFSLLDAKKLSELIITIFNLQNEKNVLYFIDRVLKQANISFSKPARDIKLIIQISKTIDTMIEKGYFNKGTSEEAEIDKLFYLFVIVSSYDSSKYTLEYLNQQLSNIKGLGPILYANEFSKRMLRNMSKEELDKLIEDYKKLRSIIRGNLKIVTGPKTGSKKKFVVAGSVAALALAAGLMPAISAFNGNSVPRTDEEILEQEGLLSQEEEPETSQDESESNENDTNKQKEEQLYLYGVLNKDITATSGENIPKGTLIKVLAKSKHTLGDLNQILVPIETADGNHVVISTEVWDQDIVLILTRLQLPEDASPIETEKGTIMPGDKVNAFLFDLSREYGEEDQIKIYFNNGKSTYLNGAQIKNLKPANKTIVSRWTKGGNMSLFTTDGIFYKVLKDLETKDGRIIKEGEIVLAETTVDNSGIIYNIMQLGKKTAFFATATSDEISTSGQSSLSADPQSLQLLQDSSTTLQQAEEFYLTTGEILDNSQIVSVKEGTNINLGTDENGKYYAIIKATDGDGNTKTFILRIPNGSEIIKQYLAQQNNTTIEDAELGQE